ncbi:MAG: glycosyltransferase [Firmicutes bacterium]|nr:glycosyltransferase [Bacillota bacterium]
MKVLFLTARAADGGSERFVSSLAGRLRAAGHECLLAYDEPGLLSETLSKEGVECIRLGLKRGDALRAPAELARIIEEKHIDAVHAQFPREYVYAVKAVKNCPGTKVIYTDHLSVRQGLKWRIINRRFGRELAAAVCVHEGGRDVLKENGLPEEKIVCIPNGVEVPEEPPEADPKPRRELGIEEEAFLCCVLARYTEEKGLDFLLDSLRILAARGRAFRCVICGDGPLFTHISERIASEGLSGSVIQAGYRKDAGRVLAASQLFLSPSRSEAMSMALLEAMACGRACVVTDAGGSGRTVESSPVCGICVKYGDAEGFASAIERYMEDPALLAQHSGNAFEKAAGFSLGAMAERYIGLYGASAGGER